MENLKRQKDQQRQPGPATTAAQQSPEVKKQPYVAPTIEVIEVKTERGYAASGTPGKWDPIGW